MIGLMVIVHQQQQTRQGTDRQTWNTGDQKICMYFSPSLTFSIKNIFLFSSFAILGKIFPRNICGRQNHRSLDSLRIYNVSTRPFSTTITTHASLQHFNTFFYLKFILTIFYVLKKHQENVGYSLYMPLYIYYAPHSSRTVLWRSLGVLAAILQIPFSVYCLIYKYIFKNRLPFLICYLHCIHTVILTRNDWDFIA